MSAIEPEHGTPRTEPVDWQKGKQHADTQGRTWKKVETDTHDLNSRIFPQNNRKINILKSMRQELSWQELLAQLIILPLKDFENHALEHLIALKKIGGVLFLGGDPGEQMHLIQSMSRSRGIHPLFINGYDHTLNLLNQNPPTSSQEMLALGRAAAKNNRMMGVQMQMVSSSLEDMDGSFAKGIRRNGGAVGVWHESQCKKSQFKTLVIYDLTSLGEDWNPSEVIYLLGESVWDGILLPSRPQEMVDIMDYLVQSGTLKREHIMDSIENIESVRGIYSFFSS